MNYINKDGFGNLLVHRKKYNINNILNEHNNELDLLFKNTQNRLSGFNIAEAERQMAMEHLRTLTVQLQTGRLKYKNKAANKYFTL